MPTKNYWFIPRPKRTLNSIPEIVDIVATSALEATWNKENQRNIEIQLEADGLKRNGERRTQDYAGGRTYVAFLRSLGLFFKDDGSHRLFPTIAGEAIHRRDNCFSVIKNQVLKFQFPSAYSCSKGVNINSRFRIHPFIFLLKLLRDPEIDHLTPEEIAKVVIVNAENDTKCYNKVKKAILSFRRRGNDSLPNDFDTLYSPTRIDHHPNPNNRFRYLYDIANTFINWLYYTRLICRERSTISIPNDKIDEVDNILKQNWTFISRPESEAIFQRKYGLIPGGPTKDTRDLFHARPVSNEIIENERIQKKYNEEIQSRPIIEIDEEFIQSIACSTGISTDRVEPVVLKLFNSHTPLDTFFDNYRNMAFSGNVYATEFEKVTVSIMDKVFGFTSKHIGSKGKTPDVLISSDTDKYSGIFDNKAYERYSISNDHKNRMIRNYIQDVNSYTDVSSHPLSFFSYIAGGFSANINSQLENILKETRKVGISISGSAISVDTLICLIKQHMSSPLTHTKLKDIFSSGRLISISDFK